MKGNLHGFLLAALMIAIAVGGTAHHLVSQGPEREARAAAPTPAPATVGLLKRRPAADAARVGRAVGPQAEGCGAPGTAVGENASPRCDGAGTASPASAGGQEAALPARP